MISSARLLPALLALFVAAAPLQAQQLVVAEHQSLPRPPGTIYSPSAPQAGAAPLAPVYGASFDDGSSSRSGLYRGTSRFVASGDVAPGVQIGGQPATFSGFDPISNEAGAVAFEATASGAGSPVKGIWVNGGASTALVAVVGGAAPGTGGLTFADFLFSLEGFSDAGVALFRSTLAGAPQTADVGLWLGSPGAVQLVAREGDPAPGFPAGSVYTGLAHAALNDAGQLAFFGYAGVLPNQTEALWTGVPGALAVVARTGDPAPGFEAGWTLRLNPEPFGFSTAGVVFRADAVHPLFPSRSAISIQTSAGLKLLAVTGEQAPGVEAGAAWSQFETPGINAAGELFFFAGTHTAVGTTTSVRWGLWTGRPGQLRLVARSGDPAPETAGANYSDSQLGLRPRLISDSGQVVFSASLNTASTNNEALFATDKTGAVRLLVRKGSRVLDSPPVFSFTLEPNTTGSGTGQSVVSNAGGFPSSIGAAGNLAVKVFWQDRQPPYNGNEAIFAWTFAESAPLIPATGQPMPVAGVLDGNATFQVGALGTRPAAFQWKRDGVDIAGATGATLTLSNLTAADRGAYTVVVTNTQGSITSDPAQLTLPPAITQEPQGQNVSAGTNVTLGVAATGPGPLAYQWQVKAAGAADFSNVPSATSATLSLSNIAVNQAGKYRVVVTNADGSGTSKEAAVTVAAAGAPILTRVLIPGDPPSGISEERAFSQAEDAVLNNEGEIAFEGKLANDSSGASLGTYFRSAEGHYRFITFQAFKLNLSDSGELAQVNSRPITTIEHGTPGNMQPLARRNTPAPNDAGSYSQDGSFNLDDSGTAAFRFDTDPFGTAVFIGKPGAVSLLARASMAAPGLAAGVQFNFVTEPVINPAGTAAFFATLKGTGITTDNDTSIWTGTAAGAQRLIAEDELVPAAGSGVKVGDIRFPDTGALPFGWNAAGQVAFATTLAGTGITTANDKAILAGTPGALVVVARDGVANGHTFDLSGRAYPTINRAGQVAFVATVTPTGSSEFLESLWLWTPGAGGGTRKLIAREGQQAAGLAAGITFDSAQLGKPFFSYALNGAGQLVVAARIAGPGISFDAGNDIAVYLTTPAGELKLVGRTGSGIDIGAGETRELASIGFAVGSGGEDGRPRSLSEDGTVVMNVALKRTGTLALDYGLFLARLPGSGPTPSTPPTATTRSATAIAQTGATLQASVNPNGAQTSVHFEYGTTTSYGQSVPAQTPGPILPAGTAAVPVSASLSGLTANTLYHFRIVATNAGGTTNGADLTFTTTTSGGGGGGNAPFTVRLKGQEDGALVLPRNGVEIEAVIEPADAGGATITGVQFLVNDSPNGAPDTEAPYELSMIVEAPGERVIVAVATDTLGRTARSAPVRFTVADAAAGVLGMVSVVEPANGTAAPGSSITYTLLVTNMGKRTKVDDVEVKAPIPQGAIFQSANFVNADNQPVKIARPRGGKNPEVANGRDSVVFYFGDIKPGETKRARLKVLVPFDAHAGDEPIRNRGFALTGQQGSKKVKGRFAEKPFTIAGLAPEDSPRLALAKGIVDLETSRTDNTEFADSPEGPIALTANGDEVTFLLVATNFGDAPASRVTLTDRIPRGFEYVEKSARVNNKAAGGVVKEKDRTLKASFGDFAPGDKVVLTYRVKVKERNQGGPAVGQTVQTAAAELRSASLRKGVDSAPERLSISILPPTVAILDAPRAFPAKSEITRFDENGQVIGNPHPQQYTIRYRNPSKREARNVRFRQELPPGTIFREASVTGSAGSATLQADGAVIYNVGTVAPGQTGEVKLVVLVTEAALQMDKPEVALPLPTTVGGQSLRRLEVGSEEGTAAHEPAASVAGNIVLDFSYFEQNNVRDPSLPQLGLFKYAPRSVPVGGEFKYILTAVNYSNQPISGLAIWLPLPPNTVYVDSNQGTGAFVAAENRFQDSFGNLPPHSVHSVTVTLRATGGVNTPIIENKAFLKTFIFAPDVPALPSATLIIAGDASAPDNQVAIARAQLTLENQDASVALADPDFLARVRQIDGASKHFLISGLDHIHLNNGGAIVPTGGGNMVAAGAGNLIGTDGATLIGTDGATLIGTDGSTLIYFGPSTEMVFNLIGTDGATLIGTDGSTLLDAVVRGLPGNMVAAGAGNLIGTDGATLIGTDGSTAFPIGPLLQSIRDAGVGAIVGAGLTEFLPDFETITYNGEAFLNAHAGGNILAAGGGNLGEQLVTGDRTQALTLGLDGSLMGGGFPRVVPTGGGN